MSQGRAERTERRVGLGEVKGFVTDSCWEGRTGARISGQNIRAFYGGTDRAKGWGRDGITSGGLEFWPQRLSIGGYHARPSSFPAPEEGCTLALPAFLPLSPNPQGRPKEEFLQLALAAKTQCHFWMSQPALEMRQAAGCRGWGGAAVSPKHSQGAPPRTNQDSGRSRAGRGPPAPAGWYRDSFDGASICLGPSLPARSGPTSPHQLPPARSDGPLPRSISIKGFTSAWGVPRSVSGSVHYEGHRIWRRHGQVGG